MEPSTGSERSGRSVGCEPPIVVIGGGLAGLAAAARLAKLGYRVELLEARDRLGGAWAPRPMGSVTIDDAPAVIGFPAPWRDLFRKSGRPLEAELTRCGRALDAAPPPRYTFDDGASLVLPTDRGDAYDVLSAAYGEGVAAGWRDLLDTLDPTWQALRPLGVEQELHDRRRAAKAARRLHPRGSIADLAGRAPHRHLGAIVRSVAYRQGSDPRHTPAWCAVDLVLARTFGRWTLDNGRTSVLIDVLAERLKLRKVAVRLNSIVDQVLVDGGRVTGVVTDQGRTVVARAVVSTVDPWQLTGRLLPAPWLRTLRRDMGRLRPAIAPIIRHELTASSGGGVEENVALDSEGRPEVTYVRPGLRSVHDFTDGAPDPAWGPAWTRRSDLARRAPITSDVAGLFLAGAASAAGNGASHVIQTGALACYASADYAGRSGFPG